MIEPLPLKVGIVCFPSFGGSGVVGAELAMGLAARGHEVHVIAAAPPARLALPQERLSFHQVHVPAYPLFEHRPYELSLASKIFEVSQVHDLDLVHVHYAVPHAPAAILARHLLERSGGPALKVVASLHGTDVTHTGSDPSYRPIVSASLAACDGITVPSEWLRQEARSRLELSKALPIEVLGNFVDSECFAPPQVQDRSRLAALFSERKEEGPVLFHVSNFRPVKRTADLIDILALLRREIPARLVLVGDGPEREAVEAKTHELGLCGSVAFLGQRTEFVEELRHADAFLLPSESESFGLAALEALSCGVPVFGYDVGGLSEVVSAEVGALVAPRDTSALAAALLEALEGEGTAARRERARVLAMERFRKEPALERYERYLREIALQPTDVAKGA